MIKNVAQICGAPHGPKEGNTVSKWWADMVSSAAEPLQNLEAVLAALQIICHPLGLHFSASKVEYSSILSPAISICIVKLNRMLPQLVSNNIATTCSTTRVYLLELIGKCRAIHRGEKCAADICTHRSCVSRH